MHFLVLDKDDDFKNFIGKDTKVEVEMLGDPELRIWATWKGCPRSTASSVFKGWPEEG